MLYNKGIKPISEEMDAKMYKYICKKLKRKGYNHYEVSNFSKEGKESKHNLTYWDNNEYYGFGLGATGYINQMRSRPCRNELSASQTTPYPLEARSPSTSEDSDSKTE